MRGRLQCARAERTVPRWPAARVAPSWEEPGRTKGRKRVARPRAQETVEAGRRKAPPETTAPLGLPRPRLAAPVVAEAVGVVLPPPSRAPRPTDDPRADEDACRGRAAPQVHRPRAGARGAPRARADAYVGVVAAARAGGATQGVAAEGRGWAKNHQTPRPPRAAASPPPLGEGARKQVQ